LVSAVSGRVARSLFIAGSKYSEWNGGIFVPALAACLDCDESLFPASASNTSREGFVHLTDLYATVCDLAGADPEDKHAEELGLPGVDSVSAWEYITGRNLTAPRSEVPVSSTTLIQGRWKLLTGEQRSSKWWGPQYPNNTSPNNGTGISTSAFVVNCSAPPYCLYDLDADFEERVNLAQQQPQVLQHMRARLAELQAGAFNPDRGSADPAACSYSQHKWGGFYGPFVDVAADELLRLP
jgi:arylsulfatase A-like enzyme